MVHHPLMHRVFLVPGFFGFTSLGRMRYFAHVHPVLGGALVRRGVDATLHDVPTLPTVSIERRAHRPAEGRSDSPTCARWSGWPAPTTERPSPASSELVHAAVGDHLDVLGYFRGPDHRPPPRRLAADPQRPRGREFEAVWDAVAGFIAASAGAAR